MSLPLELFKLVYAWLECSFSRCCTVRMLYCIDYNFLAFTKNKMNRIICYNLFHSSLTTWTRHQCENSICFSIFLSNFFKFISFSEKLKKWNFFCSDSGLSVQKLNAMDQSIPLSVALLTTHPLLCQDIDQVSYDLGPRFLSGHW